MDQSNKLLQILSGLLLASYVAHAQGPPAETIPAGTAIAIRTIDAIDSKGAELNHEYAASLADPVTVENVELAPRGASAILRVEEVKRAGKLSGRSSLTLRLIAITVGGRRVAVETGDITSKSGSQGAQTAKHSGAGAAVGAGIGAIAGGGLGAAVGAGVGAASGALISGLRTQRVRVPAETRLTFTLSQAAPLTTNTASQVVPAPVTQTPAPVPQTTAAPESQTSAPEAQAVRAAPLGPSLQPTQVEGGIRVRVKRCYRKTTEAIICEITAETLSKDMTLRLNSPDGGVSFITNEKGLQQQAVKAGFGSDTNPTATEILAVKNVPVHGQLQFATVDPAIDHLPLLILPILAENQERKFVFTSIRLEDTSGHIGPVLRRRNDH
jgi:hypothetical protein